MIYVQLLLFTGCRVSTDAITPDNVETEYEEGFEGEDEEGFEEEFEGEYEEEFEEEFEGEDEEGFEEEYEEEFDEGYETDSEEGSVASNNPISQLEAGVNEFTLEQVVAGRMVERRFLVHTPDNFDDTQNTPLLFAFHGNGGLPESYVYEAAEAVEEGLFIGVYPAGLEYSWNLGPEASQADDVAFTDAILDMLRGTSGVDANKPVAMGFSNGAGMVHELAMESSHFVAIAPATSHMLATKTPGSQAANVSVIQSSGTEDTLVPYQGGVGVLGHDFLHAEDSTVEWATHNGCNSSPNTSPDVAGSPSEFGATSYTMMEWENCSSGAKVVHVRLNNIGHDVPYDMIDGGSMPYIYNFLLQARQ